MKRFAMIDSLNTVEEFADWLWKMLVLLYLKQISEETRDFWLLNNETGCPSGTLARFYEECVPENKRLVFRQAIGELLRRHGQEVGASSKVFDEIFEDLIYFVSRISAVDLLGEVSSAVRKRLAAKRKPDVLYSTLALLMYFAPRREAYEAMSLLIDCEGFDDGYLFAAIKILAECEPTQINALIAKLKPRILNRYQLASKAGGERATNFWGEIDGIFLGENDAFVHAKILIRDCCKEKTTDDGLNYYCGVETGPRDHKK